LLTTAHLHHRYLHPFPPRRSSDLGFAATGAGTFRAVWPDNRTGVDQLWTAPITVNGTAALNGSPELAALRDVTKQVAVNVTKSRSEEHTSELQSLRHLVCRLLLEK